MSYPFGIKVEFGIVFCIFLDCVIVVWVFGRFEVFSGLDEDGYWIVSSLSSGRYSMSTAFLLFLCFPIYFMKWNWNLRFIREECINVSLGTLVAYKSSRWTNTSLRSSSKLKNPKLFDVSKNLSLPFFFYSVCSNTSGFFSSLTFPVCSLFCSVWFKL